MPIQSSYVSCGVHQFYGLSASHRRKADGTLVLRQHLDQIIWELAAWGGFTGIVVFSDADVNDNGSLAAKELREEFPTHQLTEVNTINPNSGNRIRAWLWAPDWDDVARYCDQWEIGINGATRFRQCRATQRRYEGSSWA